MGTRLTFILLLLASSARADDRDGILADDERWHLDAYQVLMVFFNQSGQGYQSQAGPASGPGDQQAYIFEPWGRVLFHQSATVQHELVIPVDIVTAASPDAVDAISAASRTNEAAGFDLRTTIKGSGSTTWSTRVTFHGEEPLASGTLGLGVAHGFAEDNTTLGANVSMTVDGFDHNTETGHYVGKTARFTQSLNLSFSQLLSPTTVFDASYGLTWQHGALETGFNRVPVAMSAEPDGMVGELLPSDRLRQAWAGRIAQHIPWSHTTLKLWYRYYRDDLGLSAHTVEATVFQYLGPRLYLRAGWRGHRQTGLDAYTTMLPTVPDPGEPRTADSDLAPFDAGELDFAAVWLGPTTVSIGYTRYRRDNDLAIDAFTFAYGRTF